MPPKVTEAGETPAEDEAPLDPEIEVLSPLDVMLRAMRSYAAKKEWDKAASLAKDVAPYMHPKLASLRQPSVDGESVQPLDLSYATEEQLAVLEQFFGPITQSFEQTVAITEHGDEGDPDGAES